MVIRRAKPIEQFQQDVFFANEAGYFLVQDTGGAIMILGVARFRLKQ